MAEGGGLLNRYRINSPIVGSNPIPSASPAERQVCQFIDDDQVLVKTASQPAGRHFRLILEEVW